MRALSWFSFELLLIVILGCCTIAIYYGLLDVERFRPNISPLKQKKPESDPRKAPRLILIKDLTARAGRNTRELHGVSLWGTAPLFRVSPSPNTVMSMADLQPTVCWAFSGSVGELFITLPFPQEVHSLSIEHLKPDKANSAPKKFQVTGILKEDIDLVVLKGEYKNDGPAKQYFSIDEGVELSEAIFKTLSNQGNEVYTCIYKIHLYTKMGEPIYY